MQRDSSHDVGLFALYSGDSCHPAQWMSVVANDTNTLVGEVCFCSGCALLYLSPLDTQSSYPATRIAAMFKFLTRKQRLSLTIAISFSFFAAEISGLFQRALFRFIWLTVSSPQRASTPGPWRW